MKKLVQWIIILICWFTLSPLFYYLAKKWKLLRTLWRAILLLISPLFWFLYAILFIVSIYLADDMQRRFQFMDHEEIAEITKSPFPSYNPQTIISLSKSLFCGDMRPYNVTIYLI